MQTVSSEDFASKVQSIKSSYHVTYKLGYSGQKGEGTYYCDCRGLILWALRSLGISASSAGTNWMIRNQMREVHKVTSASQLNRGEIVFKSRTSTAKLAAKYRADGSAYDSTIGELDVYHVGVVIQTNPLKIYHCTSGGIKVDTKLGAWNWAGHTHWVTTAISQVNTIVASVAAESGKTVNLRKDPTKKANVIKRVPIGQEVIVLSENDGWSKIVYDGKTGYMMTDFLKRG